MRERALFPRDTTKQRTLSIRTIHRNNTTIAEVYTGDGPSAAMVLGPYPDALPMIDIFKLIVIQARIDDVDIEPT